MKQYSEDEQELINNHNQDFQKYIDMLDFFLNNEFTIENAYNFSYSEFQQKINNSEIEGMLKRKSFIK